MAEISFSLRDSASQVSGQQRSRLSLNQARSIGTPALICRVPVQSCGLLRPNRVANEAWTPQRVGHLGTELGWQSGRCGFSRDEISSGRPR